MNTFVLLTAVAEDVPGEQRRQQNQGGMVGGDGGIDGDHLRGSARGLTEAGGGSLA